MKHILKIRNLTVEVEDKVILKNLDIDVEKGKNTILFGPNASGKSTLLGAIMGFESYRVTSGEIDFDGKNLLELTPDERARSGIGMMFQHPPKIRGIQLKQIADLLAGRSKKHKEMDELIDILNLDYLLERDLNLNLSGGEMKRSELFQVLIQYPKLLLLDEPESGVDLENIALMGKALNSYLKHHKVSALIISHTGYILDYVDTKYACLMLKGQICCHDDPRYIFSNIKKYGYEKCKECPDRIRINES